jgi:hypothetical protein
VSQAVDELNMVKNPRLLMGRAVPAGWRWTGDGDALGWSREVPVEGQGTVMTVRCECPAASAGWLQRVRSKPGEHYRVEIVLSGQCEAAEDDAGFVLSLQPIRDGAPTGRRMELVAPQRLDEPTILRAYYQAPPDVRSIDLQVGLRRAKGVARVHEVMMFSVLEPEDKSHVHAAVPTPYAYPPPRRIRSICVCAADRPARGRPASRPIIGLLRQRFGPRAVRTVTQEDLFANGSGADAVMVPGDTPPHGLTTLPALYKLAEERLVVLSLPAFAKIAGRAFTVRTVRQSDDPIHAKVCYANFITRGFAMADVFPYAWRGSDRRTFVQRHYRRTTLLREFCSRHGFDIILESVCNTDAASDRPVCLYKPMDSGGIVVLDVEPAEDVATNFDEPDLAFYLLLNVLGVDQNLLGQYVTAARSEKALRDEVTELGQRYPALLVRGCDHPDKPRRDQIVEVGGAADESFGLPLVRRPLILIRTGLQGDDTDGVYGAMLWLKDLVRPPPYTCPCALELISRFRLAWIPLCAEWHAGRGWRCPTDAAAFEMAVEIEPGSLAAVIDVTSTPSRRVRVVASDEAQWARYAELLPKMFRRSANGRFFYRSVPPGSHIRDRAAVQWRPERLVPEVVADETGSFDTDLHLRAAEAGAVLIRLEFPGPMADLSTGSIWRTNLVATTIEHVVALQYGWMAVNRQGEPQRIVAPSLESGAAARILRTVGAQPVDVPGAIRSNGAVILDPGNALFIAAQ